MGGSRRGVNETSGEDLGECTTSATGTKTRWASWVAILSFALSFTVHMVDSREAVDAYTLEEAIISLGLSFAPRGGDYKEQ